MVKHRRFSDKQKSGSIQEDENQNQPTSEKTSSNSYITSGMKYVYVIAITALLCGIFTPLTLGVEIEDVIFGMLIIFFGFGGGLMIFLGIKYQKLTTLMVCGGLGVMVTSLFLIYELLGKSLLG